MEETRHAAQHGTHCCKGAGGENPFVLLALSLVLASLIISAGIYFSASMVSKTIEAKEFGSSSPITINPIINITGTATAASANATAPTAAKPAAAAPAAAAGCGVPSAGGSAVGAKAIVDITNRTIKGPTTAKVTIVEFSEFLCPYCVRVQPTMAQLEKDYAGKVNFVHFNFMVHATAATSLAAVECAGDQNKYWPMQTQIYATKKTDAAGLRQLAQELGLDMTKYDACMAAGKDATIAAQKAIGSSIGVSGTPSFVIGIRNGSKVSGQMVVGAQDISAFKAAIDAQLKN